MHSCATFFCFTPWGKVPKKAHKGYWEPSMGKSPQFTQSEMAMCFDLQAWVLLVLCIKDWRFSFWLIPELFSEKNHHKNYSNFLRLAVNWGIYEWSPLIGQFMTKAVKWEGGIYSVLLIIIVRQNNILWRFPPQKVGFALSPWSICWYKGMLKI